MTAFSRLEVKGFKSHQELLFLLRAATTNQLKLLQGSYYSPFINHYLYKVLEYGKSVLNLHIVHPVKQEQLTFE